LEQRDEIEKIAAWWDERDENVRASHVCAGDSEK
jgi:hypothetical protein